MGGIKEMKKEENKEKEYDLIKMSMNKNGELSLSYTTNLLSALQSTNDIDKAVDDLKEMFSKYLEDIKSELAKRN